MKRTAILTATVCTALALTACGSSEPTDTAGAFTPAATTPTSMATPNTATPNLTPKSIGEMAGLGTPDDPVLTLTVNNIQPSDCGTNGLAINMTITTSDEWPEGNSNILDTKHWSAITTDGQQHTDINTDAYDCADNQATKLMLIEPNTNETITVVFDVPDTTKAIALQPQGQPGGWTWATT